MSKHAAGIVLMGALVLLSTCDAPQAREAIISAEDHAFLEQLAADVVEASRVREGHSAGGQGPNSTGCTLIRQ